jgi:hypothetical protein
MTIDFKALGAKAAAEGKDMTQATVGGGDYTPPPEGPCTLRFIAYLEIGKHTKMLKGVPKTTDRARMVFEVSGKNYQPQDIGGTLVPYRVTVEENLSLNEKANFFKLFTRMNYAGGAQHMVQLLGEPFKGHLYHDKWTGRDGKERVDISLRNADGYSIAPPRFQPVDPETGEPVGDIKTMNVPPALSTPKAFLWEYADKAQWDSLFIEGEYPERKDAAGKVVAPAKSKNVLQNIIKQATNFKGSPIYQVIATSGGDLNIPDVDSHDGPDDEAPAPAAESTPVGAAADDALNGVV